MRLTTIIMALGALGLSACADNSTDTSKPGETGSSDCENQIKSTYPADGEQQADYRTTIEFKLDEADSSATISSATVQGTQSVSEDGLTVIFTPSAPLTPSTEYTFDFSYCAGETSITFRTSEVGSAVDAATLTGNTYLVNLGDAEITDPPDVGDILKQYITVGILIGVTGGDSTSLDMIGALDNDATTEPDQQYCDPTIAFPTAADFSQNPYFEISGDKVSLDVAGMTVDLQDLVIGGTFAPDGSYFSGGILQGTVDTRAFDSIAGGEEGAVCSLVSSFGVECEACSSDGAAFCLTIKARNITADLASGVVLVPIEGNNCEGCVEGVPADTSDTCPEDPDAP